MQAKILKVTLLPHPAIGCIISFELDSQAVYQLSIGTFSDCTCPVFKSTIAKLGRRGEPYRPCKHLYYVFVLMCHFEADVDLFIHAPTLSFNKVKMTMEKGILDLL
ncbi:hypothetical protein M758_UG299200 [Ceratodon purpureus]|nr:hypothetical protein M758_UG299200 [Ceratodon purpureus]